MSDFYPPKIRRLSDAQFAAARQDASVPLRVNVFACLDEKYGGWCVLRSIENTLHSDLLAGPFDTSEQAEAVLGSGAPQALLEA